MGDLFRLSYRYAVRNDHGIATIGAFPVINYTPDFNFDIIFVKNSAGTITTFSNMIHDDYAIGFLHNRFRHENIIHDNVTYVTGFPNYEFSRTENGIDGGVILLKPEAVEIHELRIGTYGIPSRITNHAHVMQALHGVDQYAKENQFVGGMVDCFINSYVARVFLFKEEYFVRQQVAEWRLKQEE
ncbi:hypothetical protein [Bacillus mycoides]|nr:hypothetical protein [Bacillus mycoides]